MEGPLVIVDAANVVGSVPDVWWRDRVGATRRLRDWLAVLADRGIPELPPKWEVWLVVEGRARELDETDAVRVIKAPGSGDDTIVALLDEVSDERRCVVGTADRELIRRVTARGAETLGPRSLHPSNPGSMSP